VHVDAALLAPVIARYGEPAVMRWEGEVSEQEFRLAGGIPGRRHDVTAFVFNGDRLALIRKPQYTAGLWRPPGGGIAVGEAFLDGMCREVLEELGVDAEPVRYLVRTEAMFRFEGEELAWQTHVMEARTSAADLVPRDTHEISAARWGDLDELQGPLRAALLASDRALWRYRVALHDAAATALGGSTPS
jgi:8-oxo-dGTP pyrophosphatase MutT (NUDIX family)